MDNQLPDDGFKWFGEGFAGFPKRPPEDCVEYVIHIIDDKLKSPSATRLRLNEILKAANTLKTKLLKDYIWQRDAFDLYHHSKPDLSKPVDQSQLVSPHLQGRTNFGDSVADEWLITYLVVELSKQFPDAWIRIYDNDGEFLLIEAAAALPGWLNPDIADNRVWINKGHVKIIPLDENATSRNLAVDSALSFIRTKETKLLVDAQLETEAFNRIRDYPSAIASSLHNALITIPRNLAYILHEKPAFTSPAIEAFYLRDPVSLKPLDTKDLASLTFAPEDFVTTSVRFTKVGYAQLHSQAFDAPPAWTGILPRLRDERVRMGMKLACGFEMLLADPQSRATRSVREIRLLLSDLSNEDGSDDDDDYDDDDDDYDYDDDTDTDNNKEKRKKKKKKKKAANREDATPLPSDAQIAAWPRVQDDEKWLDIDYRDFEAELSAKPQAGLSSGSGSAQAGGKSEGSSAGGAGGDEATAQRNLRDLVSRFRDFMSKDEEVAPLDDEDDEDDDMSSSSSGSTVSSSEFQRAIDFTQVQTPATLESSGLIAEARRLALEDEGEHAAGEGNTDEPTEEEVREVMARMERELRGHGALKKNSEDRSTASSSTKLDSFDAAPGGKGKGKGKEKVTGREVKVESTKSFFGPERPPHLRPSTVSKAGVESDDDDDDDDVGPGDLELSSDEDDGAQDVNDVDLEFARNMLEAFKGQAGMSGPTGNLMRALGVGSMPRDEDEGG